mgnify:CR=1 FL=1|tara:strand:- start:900 stop:1136 length:237 start_codon:yes stop_codon:yes gene_type:complete
MDTNVILFFSAVAMLITFAIGAVIGWIYKSTVDTHTLKRQMNNLHPEFLDGNGAYVNEELLAVKFIDPEDILDEDGDI